MGKLGRNCTRVAAMLSVFLIISACETTSQKDVGAALGLVVGAVAGAALGNRDGGSKLGAFIGGAVGSIAGAMIGAKLDEIDRRLAEAAKTTALSVPTGNRVEWRSQENVSVNGYATPVTDVAESEGRTCRTVRQVAIINGEEIEETTEFCRVGNTGRWVAG